MGRLADRIAVITASGAGMGTMKRHCTESVAFDAGSIVKVAVKLLVL